MSNMISKRYPVIWNERGVKPIRGVIDVVMDGWFAVQWENGSYVRYRNLDIPENIKPDLQKLRETKLDELFKSEKQE